MDDKDAARAAFKLSELDRIADLHPGVDKLLADERNRTLDEVESYLPPFSTKGMGNSKDAFYMRGIEAEMNRMRSVIRDLRRG